MDYEIVTEQKNKRERPEKVKEDSEDDADENEKLGLFRKANKIGIPIEDKEKAPALAQWDFQQLSESAKTEDKENQRQQLTFEELLDEENEYLQKQKRRQLKLQQLQSGPIKKEEIKAKLQKQAKQNLKKEQRKANVEGNQTWSLKMHGDEEIDFEQLLEDEQKKQKE